MHDRLKLFAVFANGLGVADQADSDRDYEAEGDVVNEMNRLNSDVASDHSQNTLRRPQGF